MDLGEQESPIRWNNRKAVRRSNACKMSIGGAVIGGDSRGDERGNDLTLVEEQVPDIAATIEAPVIDSPETPEIETPVSEPSAEPETPQTDEPITADSKEDGRQFAGKLRDHYKELIASNDPNKVQLAKAVKDLFFQNKALRDKFPGGVKEVEERLAAFDKYGAPEQLEALQADAKTLEDIDTKWQAGDPRFIDELAELNAESFKKLMPVGLNKFAQVDPEGYQRVMSGILSSTLAQAKMGDQLYLISRELQRGDTAEAINLVKQIQDWMGELDKSAKAPVTTPQNDPRNAEFEQRAAQLEEQKAEFFNTQLANEVTSWRDSQIKSALGKLTNGAKVDADRMEIFQDRVIRELVKLHPTDFQAKWERHYAQGDKSALVKFIQGADGPNITKAVAKVHALLFPSNGVKKAPVTVPAAQPTAKPAEVGWVKGSPTSQPRRHRPWPWSHD